MKRLAILATLISSTLVAAVPAQAPDAAPPGNSERGKKLYVERGCWTCHGYAAQGGGSAGPRLAGRLADWPRFLKYVRQPGDEMIPYTTKVVADQELADIYAWLKAIPAPPSVNSIPQLRD